MPYYITATNDVCDGQAVNIAYQQELQKCGNWYTERSDAEKEVQERNKRKEVK